LQQTEQRGLTTSVCLLVNFVRPAKDGRTDRYADWRVDSGGLKEPCIRWGPDSQAEGEISWCVRLSEKQCESLLRCTQHKTNNGISATAAADCIAPD